MNPTQQMMRKLAVAVQLFVLGLPAIVFAQDLRELRQYEPVVKIANHLPALKGIPVNEMRLYTWHASTQTWEAMPFQVDERSLDPTPSNLNHRRWFYFRPGTSGDSTEHNHVFDRMDELVFMLRDAGDEAPADAWIDNPESRQHPRNELKVIDPDNPNLAVFAYVFRSHTFTEPVPTPYAFAYSAASNTLSTTYYMVGFGTNGLIQDISINQPWGSGLDFFDALKIRFGGVINFFIPLELVLKETNIFLYDDTRVTEQPVVRLVRQTRQTIRVGTFILHDTPFYAAATFHPFGGTTNTGASIAQEDLQTTFGNVRVGIILNSVRYSLDLNASASGATFSNRRNAEIPVNGVPDVVDHTIPVPVNEWFFVTGNHGSLLSSFQIAETDWDGVSLYFHDSADGGQADSEYHGDNDTGDGKSYGDHGILFTGHGRDSLNLDLNFSALFIPETDVDLAEAERMGEQFLRPLDVDVTSVTDTGVDDPSDTPRPESVRLLPNAPNPFNASTRIPFVLPHAGRVRLEIVDARGRLVRVLRDGILSAGTHSVVWDGRAESSEVLASGVYVSRLIFERQIQTRKLVLLQ